MDVKKKKIIAIVGLIIFALISFFGLSKIATSPKVYSNILETLQEKENTVTAISLGCSAAATALALVPSDTTTPIANHILQVSSYLLIVLCTISLEKSLITVLGFLSFKILIPLACFILIINALKKQNIESENEKKSNKATDLSFKLFVLSIALVVIIPVSVKIGDLICQANKEAIDQVIEVSEEKEMKEEGSEKEEGKISSIFSSIKNGASDIADKAEGISMKFTNAIVIFIVSNCLIPICVIGFLMWLIKVLFGLSFDTSFLHSKVFGKIKHLSVKNNKELVVKNKRE